MKEWILLQWTQPPESSCLAGVCFFFHFPVDDFLRTIFFTRFNTSSGNVFSSFIMNGHAAHDSLGRSTTLQSKFTSKSSWLRILHS